MSEKCHMNAVGLLDCVLLYCSTYEVAQAIRKVIHVYDTMLYSLIVCYTEIERIWTLPLYQSSAT